MLNGCSRFLICNMSVKVKESGSETSTTTVWTAPQTLWPERSGLKSLTTPVTQGNMLLHFLLNVKDWLNFCIFTQLTSCPLICFSSEVVCSSFQHEPALLASTLWQPTESSSLTPHGIPPMTSRVSSGCTDSDRSGLSTCTDSWPRWVTEPTSHQVLIQWSLVSLTLS